MRGFFNRIFLKKRTYCYSIFRICIDSQQYSPLGFIWMLFSNTYHPPKQTASTAFQGNIEIPPCECAPLDQNQNLESLPIPPLTEDSWDVTKLKRTT